MNTILSDLLIQKNVEYCFLHGKYPSNASKMGMEFEKELKKIFSLEDDLRKITVKFWENGLTRFEDIINVENFMIVGHASKLLPGTPDLPNYKSNRYSKQFLSCSLLSNNEFNTFDKIKIFYVVDVNARNYISSSSYDCVTHETSVKTFETLGRVEIDNEIHYINVGFSHDTNRVVTKISTPSLIDSFSVNRELKQNGELFSYDNSLTNEVVLDRTNSKIVGTLLISNGCDLLLNEYLFLKTNGINFKCLNKGLYRRKKGLSDYTEKEFMEFRYSLQEIGKCLDYYSLSHDVLIDYYNDVVLQMGYSEEIVGMIFENFLKYIDISSLDAVRKK